MAQLKSLPSRERGLKSQLQQYARMHGIVAPFAGAWIEILRATPRASRSWGRSLRGSVD